MTLNDRFTKGLISGLCGGIASLCWGLTSKFILNFATLLYADFAAVIVYGRKSHGLYETAFSLIIVFLFFGFNGITFSFLIRQIESKNLILKGSLWGGAIWFFSYAITLLFNVPEFKHITMKTSVSQLIGGLIWGGLMAWVLGYLDRKTSKNLDNN